MSDTPMNVVNKHALAQVEIENAGYRDVKSRKMVQLLARAKVMDTRKTADRPRRAARDVGAPAGILYPRPPN
jgi:hypothetical protein